MPTLEGIIFYPELRFHGMRVYPEHWHGESEQPLLHCLLHDNNPAVDAESGTTMGMIHEARESGQRERWEQLGRRRETASRIVMERLLEEGWEQLEAGLFAKYLHVDELEKIEGPPPEGSF